jgi:hypothetical protein
MNATLTSNQFIFLFRKSNKDFSYTIFPVKKNKCWKNYDKNRYLIILSIHILKLEISGCDSPFLLPFLFSPLWSLMSAKELLENSSCELFLLHCHTCFSKENQVQTYMHARIKFHAYSDI